MTEPGGDVIGHHSIIAGASGVSDSFKHSRDSKMRDILEAIYITNEP